MTNNEIQEKLRSSNIFSAAVAALPFHNTAPDLKELNQKTSEHIEEMIKYKIENPTTPISGLILSDAGAGKTHMLSRIYRRIKEISNNTFFVSIRAFMNPDSLFQDVFSDLIVNLNHKNNPNDVNEKSQFDIIIQRFTDKIKNNDTNDKNQSTDSILDSFVQNIFGKFLNKNKKKQITMLKLICKNIPGIDTKFANCLASYLITDSTPEGMLKKFQIMEWLRDGLTEVECEALYLPLRDVKTMNKNECENEALKFLISLGLLLQYSNSNIVLCFDQIDGMKDRDLIVAWGNVFSFIVNSVYCVIPLVFARPYTWSSRFEKYLDEAHKARFEGNTMIMTACTLEQAKFLIKLRIESYFPENEVDEIYNTLINRLLPSGKIKNGYSPRRVIETANKEIWENWEDFPPTPTKIEEQIKKKFDEKREIISQSADFYPPSEQDILLALGIWLNSQDDLNFTYSENKISKLLGYFKNTREITIMISLSKSPKYNIKLIDECISFMGGIENINPEKRCCFISETSIITKTSKATQGKLTELENSGGMKILLDSETRVNVYTLSELVKDVNNQRITLYLQNSEIKNAELNDVIAFLKNFPLIENLIDYLKNPVEISNLNP